MPTTSVDFPLRWAITLTSEKRAPTNNKIADMFDRNSVLLMASTGALSSGTCQIAQLEHELGDFPAYLLSCASQHSVAPVDSPLPPNGWLIWTCFL